MTRLTLTEAEARDYVTRMLRMNPLFDPAGVLALRRATLGLKAAVGDGPSAARLVTPGERAAVVASIDRPRRDFWKLPIDQLQASLGAVDVKRLPDLRPLLDRLRAVASCRGEFARLAAAPGVYLPLVHAFKTAVVLPPGEAGPCKDQYIRGLKDRGQLKATRRTVTIVGRDFALLYPLEKDWFETLRTVKLRRAPTEPVSYSVDFSGWTSFSPAMVVIVLMLIRFFFAALR